MRRLILRAWRRSPGQYLAVGAVTIMVSAALYLGIVGVMGLQPSIEARFDELNAEDGQLVATSAEIRDDALASIEANEDVESYTTEKVKLATLSFDFAEEQTSALIMIRDRDHANELGKTEVIESRHLEGGDTVEVPYSFQVAGGYELGDVITFSAGELSLVYRISGFTENAFNSTLSLGMPSIAVPSDEFAALTSATDATLIKVRTTEPSEAAAVISETVDAMSAAAADRGEPAPWAQTETKEIVRSAMSVSGTLLGGITLAVGVVLVMVAVVLCAFLVRVTVARELPAIGILKAIGYRPGKALFAVVAPFLLTTLLASLLGIGVGIVCSPLYGEMVAAQTGLRWHPAVSYSAGLGALGFAMLGTGLAIFASAAQARKLSVVAALRGAQGAKQSRINWLPLRRAKGRLSVVLGLKQALQAPGQTIVLSIVVALVSVSAAFAIGLQTRLLADQDAFVELIGGNLEDVALNVEEGHLDQVRDQVRSDPDVAEAGYGTNYTVSSGDASFALGVQETYAMMGEDWLLEGKVPNNQDQVVVGNPIATELGKSVGDEITIQQGDRTTTYEIAGIIQTGVALGEVAYITLEGMERLDPDLEISYLQVWLKDPSMSSDWAATASQTYADQISSVSEVRAAVFSQLTPYSNMATVLSWVIVAATMLVAIIILSLLVTSQLLARRGDDAIQLAVGMSVPQLRTQAVISLLLPVTIGGAIGLALSPALVSPLVSVMLSSIGIERLSLSLGLPGSVLLGIGILVLAAAVLWRSTIRLRNLSPATLASD